MTVEEMKKRKKDFGFFSGECRVSFAEIYEYISFLYESEVKFY